MHRALAAGAVAAGLLALAVGGAPDAGARRGAASEPLAVVVRTGGFCAPPACRTTYRITDTTISGDGYRSRPLGAADRRALRRAIGALDPAYLRAHPFTGTCPTAYDGPESVYRFRGFPRWLRSCTYDLRGVRAVQVVERLLATLTPRP